VFLSALALSTAACGGSSSRGAMLAVYGDGQERVGTREVTVWTTETSPPALALGSGRLLLLPATSATQPPPLVEGATAALRDALVRNDTPTEAPARCDGRPRCLTLLQISDVPAVTLESCAVAIVAPETRAALVSAQVDYTMRIEVTSATGLALTALDSATGASAWSARVEGTDLADAAEKLAAQLLPAPVRVEGVRSEPVYATRRRLVGLRRELLAPTRADAGLYLGLAVDYEPVPAIGVFETVLAIGGYIDRPTVEHVIVGRFSLAAPLNCHEGTGGGVRATYAARFKLGDAYLGPEVGLGAIATYCADGRDLYSEFLEFVGVGVVGGYRIGRWSIGGSARVGLGTGNSHGMVDDPVTGWTEVYEESTTTLLFGVETGWSF
jgi:hypothetical protein